MTLITLRPIIILFIFAMVLNIGTIPLNVYAQPDSEIRLVLQITVDGLRADLINRYENGFGEGGFRLLMKKGTYSTNTGDFVTSAYYYDAYPDWVRAWNERRPAEGYAGKSWTLLKDAST